MKWSMPAVKHGLAAIMIGAAGCGVYALATREATAKESRAKYGDMIFNGFHDVNADGIQELVQVFSKTTNRDLHHITLYIGQPNKVCALQTPPCEHAESLRQIRSLEFPVAFRPTGVYFSDQDGDGREDIFLQYRRAGERYTAVSYQFTDGSFSDFIPWGEFVR